MIERNEYRAYFTLVGHFHPDEISNDLALQPTRSWTKGEVHPSTGLVTTFSRWSLESRMAQIEYIDPHVEDILLQLMPATEAVLRLRAKYDGWLQLVAFFLNGQASVKLSAELIERLSKLRLGLDFDPYDLAGEDASCQ